MQELTTEQEQAIVMKQIPGIQNDYMAGSDGFIYSFMRYQRGCRLDGSLDQDGYPAVTLFVNNIRKRYIVHRLICKAFHGGPSDKQQCNHVNGIKHDNRPENLEWVSQSENQRHRYRVLGHKTPNRKITNEQVILIRSAEKYYGYINELAKKLNLTRGDIKNVLSNKYYSTPSN
jgi:hypothetical protein